MLTYDITNKQRIVNAVKRFSEYSNGIESVLNDILNIRQPYISSNQIDNILNGQARDALQRLIPITERKEAGIFFTDSGLADKVAAYVAPILRNGIELYDPACGAGNLLIACSRYLPTANSFQTTLNLWSRFIFGCDLFSEFILATRLRLILAAANRHIGEQINLDNATMNDYFQGVATGNVLLQTQNRITNRCIVVNPPYGYTKAPKDCKWATGNVQIAGLFIEKLLRNAPNGQHIVAILPDVLNSGTRYQRWRELILKRVSSITVEQVGRFDDDTDVDVFILHVVASNTNHMVTEWPRNLPSNGFDHKISTYFDIHVGSVVPHRDQIDGKSHPYVYCDNALQWQTVNYLPEKIQTKKTIFTPPFLILRRTSSPSDKQRCIATIINEKQKVAVENHLLVFLPKDKSLSSCKQLMEIFRDSKTAEWLNNRTRCRHLTVSALRDLPCDKL